MNDYWKLAFALTGMILGGLITCQAGVNSNLRTHLNYPIQAAFISFLVGTTILAVLCLGIYLQGQQPWFKGGITLVPWWAWTGGMIGALFVSSAIFMAPRLGAILFTLTLVSGQIFTAMMLEHFGAAGYPQIPLSGNRIAGAILVLAGILLIVLWPSNESPSIEKSNQDARSPSDIISEVKQVDRKTR